MRYRSDLVSIAHSDLPSAAKHVGPGPPGRTGRAVGSADAVSTTNRSVPETASHRPPALTASPTTGPQRRPTCRHSAEPGGRIRTRLAAVLAATSPAGEDARAWTWPPRR